MLQPRPSAKVEILIAALLLLEAASTLKELRRVRFFLFFSPCEKKKKQIAKGSSSRQKDIREQGADLAWNGGTIAALTALTAVHTNRRPIKFWEQTEDRTDLCCRPEQKKTKVAAAAAAAKSLRHPSHYTAETFVLSFFGEATVLFVQFKNVAKAKCFQCDG